MTEGLCSVRGEWLSEIPFRFTTTAWVVPEGGDARQRTVETQPAGFVLDPSVVPEHAVTAGATGPKVRTFHTRWTCRTRRAGCSRAS